MKVSSDRSSLALVVAALLLGCPGCYLAHERAPSCAEHVPDPAAMPAVAPPDDAAALEPVSEASSIAETRVPYSIAPPLLVSDGDGWGVTWAGALHLLDRDGVPAATSNVGGITGMAFAERFALAAPSVLASSLWLFDRGAARIGEQHEYGGARTSDVAWLEDANAWIVASEARDAASRPPAPDGVRVDVFGSSGALLDTMSVETGTWPSEATTRVAASRTRALIVWLARGAVRALALGGSPLGVVTPAFDVLSPTSPAGADFGAAVPSVVAYGERFLVGAGDPHHLYVALVDVAGCSPSVAVASVADTDASSVRAAIAAVPDRGF